MASFGQEIRDLRLAKHFTQKDLANKIQRMGLRCEFTYISKIENDRLESPPSEDLIRAIAITLGGDAEKWLSLAGQFDKRSLQEVVEDIPDVGVLLRKLQRRDFSEEEIQEFIDKNEKKDSN